MRLYEFADAEAQLGLLRIIIDNTWSAIAQQAEQEQRAEAERKAQAKLKPRTKKSTKGTSIRIPTPPPPLAKKPQTPLANQPPSPLNNPNPSAFKAVDLLPATNPQIKQQPNPAANTPIKPIASLKMGTLSKDKNIANDFVNGSEIYSPNTLKID